MFSCRRDDAFETKDIPGGMTVSSMTGERGVPPKYLHQRLEVEKLQGQRAIS
jgi:hypothetical protein